MVSECSVCSNCCWGIEDNHGSCCSVKDRDWIIGAHTDSHEFVESLSNKFGRRIKHEDIFYTFEEGSKIFPNKPSWQNPNNYPCLKIDLKNPKLPCIFYNTTVRACTVYEIRPTTCKTYMCDYLLED